MLLIVLTGLFHRKRGRDNSKSPRGSPELRRKAETKESSDNDKPNPLLEAPAEEIRKRRTVSDVTPLLQEKWVTVSFKIFIQYMMQWFYVSGVV